MPEYTFTINGNDEHKFGCVGGQIPLQAATRAFTTIMRNNENTSLPITITLKEINSENVISFICNRSELDTPQTINIAGKEMMFRYRNIIEEVKLE